MSLGFIISLTIVIVPALLFGSFLAVKLLTVIPSFSIGHPRSGFKYTVQSVRGHFKEIWLCYFYALMPQYILGIVSVPIMMSHGAATNFFIPVLIYGIEIYLFMVLMGISSLVFIELNDDIKDYHISRLEETSA